jgi:glutamate---cysteine ligase / carboxylate-amine ligase
MLTAAQDAEPVVPPAVPPLDVEEEFLLLDPQSGMNRPVAEQVRAALPDEVRDHGLREARRSVLAMGTGTCTGLDDLRRRLLARRRAAARAAAQAGARLVAVAATPVGEPEPGVVDDPRHRAMAARYGPVATDPAVCGLRVRVDVADRDLAVQVCNHVQVWLPVIRALTGNSPLFEGTDTGYASWRSVQVMRWPGIGPTPWFDSSADYDETVDELMTSGALLDPAMVAWYARLSRTGLAVEIRVNDVCADVDDAVLTAALVRAAVVTAVTDVRAGHPAVRQRVCVTNAAHWRAARDGLAHTLVDLRLGRTRPAWELISEFFAVVSPALLQAGDLDRVVQGLARLRRQGEGATWQRATYRRTGDLCAMIAALAAATTAG